MRRRRTQAARGKTEAAKAKASSSSSSSKGGKQKKKKMGYRGGGGGAGKKLNKLLLSPGTALMDELERGVRAAFPWAYVSGCDEAGEGEIKAVHFLLHHQHLFQGQRVVLLGGDADLVLIGSAARPLTNIFCVHSNGGGGGGGRGGNDRRGGGNNRGGGRQSRYTSVAIQDLWKIAAPLTREDVCVAAMLTGNDYLPRLAGASMQLLLERAHRAVVVARCLASLCEERQPRHRLCRLCRLGGVSKEPGLEQGDDCAVVAADRGGSCGSHGSIGVGSGPSLGGSKNEQKMGQKSMKIH